MPKKKNPGVPVRVRLSAKEGDILQELQKRTGHRESDLLRDALRAGLPKIEKLLDGPEPQNIIPFPLSPLAEQNPPK